MNISESFLGCVKAFLVNIAHESNNSRILRIFVKGVTYYKLTIFCICLHPVPDRLSSFVSTLHTNPKVWMVKTEFACVQQWVEVSSSVLKEHVVDKQTCRRVGNTDQTGWVGYASYRLHRPWAWDCTLCLFNLLSESYVHLKSSWFSLPCHEQWTTNMRHCTRYHGALPIICSTLFWNLRISLILLFLAQPHSWIPWWRW